MPLAIFFHAYWPNLFLDVGKHFQWLYLIAKDDILAEIVREFPY